eukprot:jgi/Chrzof1/4716/Cz14g23260.t1
MIPHTHWPQQLLSAARQLPGDYSQVMSLQQLLAQDIAGVRMERSTLHGWLVGMVCSVGEVQQGYGAAHGASSRSWTACCITLTSSDQSTSASGNHSMQLWLYDDATRYSQLLVVGELVALYCPVVRALPQQSEEQPVQWVLEVASGTLVSVKASAEGDDDDVHDMDLDDAVIKPDARPTPTNNTSTNQSHTSQSTERLNALVPLNKLQPNLQDVVVCGTVSGLRCVRGCLLHGRALVGWIKDDTGAVAALHMEVYNSSKVQGKTVGH